MQLLTGCWISKLEMVHKAVLEQTPFTCAHIQHCASNAHHSLLSIKYTVYQTMCGLDEVCLRVEGGGCEGRSGTYKLLLCT